jgi:glutaredoxin
MESVSPLLLVAGIAAAVVSIVASITLIIRAFQTSILWGLAMFVPFGQIAFLIRHWHVASGPFFLQLAASLVFLGSIVFDTLSSTDSNSDAWTKWLDQVAPTKESLTDEINELRDTIASTETTLNQKKSALQKTYAELGTRQKSLSEATPEQAEQFRRDLEYYKRELVAYNDAEAELRENHKQLNELIRKRTSILRSEPSASSKQVVLLTAPGCGACKQAKSYLASHGIPYVEHNVSTSEYGRQQMLKLGARAVPVLIIGNRHKVGFSPQWVEQQLADS